MPYEEVQTIEAFGMPYTETRYYPSPVDVEVPIITIEFKPETHPNDDYCYSQPQFVFLDVVVLLDKWEYCQMHQLDVNSELDFFRIVGMKLVESRSKSGRLTEAPYWLKSGRLTEAPYWLYEIECNTRSTEPIWISEEELIAQRDLEPSLSEF